MRQWIAHPAGEQPEVEERSAVADTFAGRAHIEWDTTAPVTPLGQLPFFIEYLKQGGLFDGWVADCPLSFTSPNAPSGSATAISLASVATLTRGFATHAIMGVKRIPTASVRGSGPDSDVSTSPSIKSVRRLAE